MLASGSVDVFVNGQHSRFDGPACICIKADAHHGIHAITDAVWFCIHAVDATDSESDDRSLVSAGSDFEEARSIGESMMSIR